MEPYSIPLFCRSSFKKSTVFLFVFTAISMTALSIFSLAIITKEDFLLGLILGVFLLAFGLLSFYMIIYMGILKKGYIEVTPEYFKLSSPYKTRTVNWGEIYEANMYTLNNNIMIGILLNKDVNKKRKRTISNNFNSIYGVPAYSFQISLLNFKDLEPEKLLVTIGEQINKVPAVDAPEEIVEDDNLLLAIIISAFFSLLASIIYGYLIYKLKKNFIVIPILSSFFIISVFNKYYLERSFNFFVRFFLGLICFLQVPAGIISAILIAEKVSITCDNILIAATDYFTYLGKNLPSQFLVILAAITCFIYGTFLGRVKNNK